MIHLINNHNTFKGRDIEISIYTLTNGFVVYTLASFLSRNWRESRNKADTNPLLDRVYIPVEKGTQTTRG